MCNKFYPGLFVFKNISEWSDFPFHFIKEVTKLSVFLVYLNISKWSDLPFHFITEVTRQREVTSLRDVKVNYDPGAISKSVITRTYV
jgi:hypothetical protein